MMRLINIEKTRLSNIENIQENGHKLFVSNQTKLLPPQSAGVKVKWGFSLESAINEREPLPGFSDDFLVKRRAHAILPEERGTL